ncbi:MAG: hypothetical protein JWQ40_1390 [Segetibacter sp.]|nr:hypothetical protein [Segetibacter sp.]
MVKKQELLFEILKSNGAATETFKSSINYKRY